MLVQHPLHRLADPCRRMHAIRDRAYRKFREHRPRHLAMLHRHAVCIAREFQCQKRHVQQSFVEASQRFQARRPLPAQNANRLLGREPVVSRRHRSVRREHASPPHHLNVRIRRRALRPAAQLALQQRQRQQRRVALVHVVHVNAQTQRVRHAHAAHSQNNFLLQAVVRVPAVKMIREPAIPSGVFVQVGVQQINRHHVPELPLQVIPPCAQRHRAPFHCNRHPRGLFRAVVRRVPRLHFLGLRAIRVQMLLEIPLTVDERKCRKRNAQVCCRPQRVPRQHAKSTGVRGHLRTDRDLHAEVGHQARLWNGLV